MASVRKKKILIAYLGFAVAFTLFMLCMYVFPYVEAL